MFTGKDVAEFLTQQTGEDYVGLYDAAVKEDQVQMESIIKKFNGLVDRMNESDKNRVCEKVD